MEGFDCFSAHSVGSIVSSFPAEGPPALLREDREAHLSLTSDLSPLTAITSWTDAPTGKQTD